MRTGAASTENTASITIDSARCTAPPKRLGPFAHSTSTLRILGRNSTVAVAENSAAAFSGCHSGQIGKSWRGCVKYSGAISVCLASSAVDSSRNRNHSGADR